MTTNNKRITKHSVQAAILAFALLFAPAVPVAAACSNEPSVLGIKSWYQFVPRGNDSQGRCTLDFNATGVGTVWLILAGLADILLRLAVLIAVGYFIYGAFRMITSQGSPEGVKGARSTMVNAVIGLIISVMASQILGFIMGNILKVTV